MKIATWNVNSITVRLPQVLEWIDHNRPDVCCLQETKCVDEKFPADAFKNLGYQVEVFGQRTYNGVAIVSLSPVNDVRRGLPGDETDTHCRLIAGTVDSIRIVDVYIPNGSEVGSDKYVFKLAWLARLHNFLDRHCDPKQPLVLCGDFNVAPEDRDIHDPVLWDGKIMCSDAERAALKNIREWGLVDVFRIHHEEAGHFSWWDYRAGAFRRNNGLRIDHIWATEILAKKSVNAWIDRIPRALEKPSDHVPVVVELAV